MTTPPRPRGTAGGWRSARRRSKLFVRLAMHLGRRSIQTDSAPIAQSRANTTSGMPAFCAPALTCSSIARRPRPIARSPYSGKGQ
eukprot:589874-Alexandrium_andersonii.AAC.1